MSEKEIIKIIDNEIWEKETAIKTLLKQYKPISHISNKKSQDLKRDMKKLDIEIGCLKELKQKVLK